MVKQLGPELDYYQNQQHAREIGFTHEAGLSTPKGTWLVHYLEQTEEGQTLTHPAYISPDLKWISLPKKELNQGSRSSRIEESNFPGLKQALETITAYQDQI